MLSNSVGDSHAASTDMLIVTDMNVKAHESLSQRHMQFESMNAWHECNPGATPNFSPLLG